MTYTGFEAEECLGECVTLRTINQFTGHHWKNFLTYLFGPLLIHGTK